MHLWIKAGALLVGVWLLVAGVIFVARSAKPTPESVVRYAEEHPVEGKTPAERERIMRKLANELNQLDYDQRREVRMGKRLEVFFKSLQPQEQSHFIDLTFPAGFRKMMDSFNKMTPQKRKQFVERTLADMRRRGAEEEPPRPDDPNVQKIIAQGLHSFYSEASAETKLDLAPLVEQMQMNLQGLR